MVGLATQLNTGWIVEKDCLAGEEHASMKVKAMEIGTHKQDGHGEVLVNME